MAIKAIVILERGALIDVLPVCGTWEAELMKWAKAVRAAFPRQERPSPVLGQMELPRGPSEESTAASAHQQSRPREGGEARDGCSFQEVGDSCGGDEDADLSPKV